MSNPIYDLFIKYATDGPSSEMSLPEFSEAVNEARADQRRKDCAAVCWACNPNNTWGFGEAARMGSTWWQHANNRGDIQACQASGIHELQHQETQERPKP